MDSYSPSITPETISLMANSASFAVSAQEETSPPSPQHVPISFASPGARSKAEDYFNYFPENQDVTLPPRRDEVPPLCKQIANLKFSTISSTPTVATFTKFSELVPELRLKIWAFTLGPRILRIDQEWRRIHEDAGSFRYHALTPDNLYHNLITYQVPTIVHVCQESRMVGMEIFQSSRLNSSEYKVDILHLTKPDLKFLNNALHPIDGNNAKFKSRPGQEIRSIVINAELLLRERAWWDRQTTTASSIGLDKTFRSLGNLESLYILPTEECWYNENKSLRLLGYIEPSVGNFYEISHPRPTLGANGGWRLKLRSLVEEGYTYAGNAVLRVDVWYRGGNAATDVSTSVDDVVVHDSWEDQ
jgi:hypothetical protein